MPGIAAIREMICAAASTITMNRPPVRDRSRSSVNRLFIDGPHFLVRVWEIYSQFDLCTVSANGTRQLTDGRCQDGIHVGRAANLVCDLKQDSFTFRLGAYLLQQASVSNDGCEASA